ncbi:UTRA domain-containing protein [Nonomuraea mesophila]|uniref:UTRA domain-containing protein n=1 Tax=Nonomuraea mesophila TaxID=2530382 RepID=UPI001408474C
MAALLKTAPTSKAFLRRRVVLRDGESSQLVSLWLPPELSEGIDLTSGEPLPQGIREHLTMRKGVRFDHIVEQITARMPTAQETMQLGMPKNVPLLAVFGAVRDASGRPLAVVEVLLPADRHEYGSARPPSPSPWSARTAATSSARSSPSRTSTPPPTAGPPSPMPGAAVHAGRVRRHHRHPVRQRRARAARSGIAAPARRSARSTDMDCRASRSVPSRARSATSSPASRAVFAARTSAPSDTAAAWSSGNARAGAN